MAKRTARERGRPKGSGLYDAGTLRFAVSTSLMQELMDFQRREKLPNISEAARLAIKRGVAK